MVLTLSVVLAANGIIEPLLLSFIHYVNDTLRVLVLYLLLYSISICALAQGSNKDSMNHL